MSGGAVLVIAALGNVGAATADSLLARGARVRVADVDLARLQSRFPDAEAVRLDLLDPTTFAAAVDGAESMFLLRPPPISRVGPTLNRLVDVAGQRGVQHVVFSSVQGADTNKIVPHHRVETHLRASGLGWTMLRPGFFAQNLTGAYAWDIREKDRLYVPAGQGRVAFIDAGDIGEVAGAVLMDPTPHLGRGYTLTGPEALTFEQVVHLLTTALGRVIRYEPATVLGYGRHLHGQGLPLAQVAVQTILHVGLRRGDAETVTTTVDGLLGRPATPLADVIGRNLDPWLPAAA